MNSRKTVLRAMVAALALYGIVAHAEPLKANVIHWWTSGGESAAIRQFADAYNKAGGQWVDEECVVDGPIITEDRAMSTGLSGNRWVRRLGAVRADARRYFPEPETISSSVSTR